MMKPAAFGYHRAGSVDEAVTILAGEGDEAKIIAGGQSLIPMLNLRLAYPRLLVDIAALPLRQIDRHDDYIRIGSMACHRQLTSDPMIRSGLPLLAVAASHIGHPAIRNRGTLGGSLAHADPAAELPAVAVALSATIQVCSKASRRSIPAVDFFDGPFMTTLGSDEIIVAVDFPAPPDRRAAFEEVTIRSGDFAVAAVACSLRASRGAVADVRLALAGVAGKPVRAAQAEQLLDGRVPTAELVAKAGALAAQAIRPGADVDGSDAYPRALVPHLVERAIFGALGGQAR
jgi:carbon-monoxide dehydrogenase medium subunit